MTVEQKKVLDRIKRKDGENVTFRIEHGYILLEGGAMITPNGYVINAKGYVVEIPM